MKQTPRSKGGRGVSDKATQPVGAAAPEDPKARALDGLAGMVDTALSTLRDSLSEDRGRRRREGNRCSTARYVLDAVLERAPAPEKASLPDDMTLDELAVARERLRVKRMAERRK